MAIVLKIQMFTFKLKIVSGITVFKSTSSWFLINKTINFVGQNVIKVLFPFNNSSSLSKYYRKVNLEMFMKSKST